ncbi:Protein roadkill [Aphelenchoides besseyi]|nr:Protein roadkill [Aphelenchoides besseyi]KAI6224982.1 Protein roadkill [Aphelenchoides besseyi]
MQRGWVSTYQSGSQAVVPPPQENSVSEGNDRSTSPFSYSYNTYEADPGTEVESSHYDSSSIADNWCQTQMNVIKFNYMWTINNFSYCHEEMGEVLKSSTFGANNNDKLRWCLRINPKGLDDESKDYLSLYLLLVQSNKPDVRAKFKFSILNADREESKAMESQRAYRFVQGKDWGFKKFIRRDYLLDDANGLLPEDRLSIYCEVSIVTDAVNLTGQSIMHLPVPASTLSEDFSSLFADELFTDCIIKVGSVEIKTHKAILSARSTVFKAMFAHSGMKESNNSVVVIEDLDEETVRGMLSFIYSDNVRELNKIALKLLAAGDKYALKRLKVMCERALCISLHPQNVCEILVHADRHSADQLKSRCVSFIIQHSAEVMESEGWQCLAKEFGYLLAHVCKAMATQQNSVPLSPPLKKRRSGHY